MTDRQATPKDSTARTIRLDFSRPAFWVMLALLVLPGAVALVLQILNRPAHGGNGVLPGKPGGTSEYVSGPWGTVVLTPATIEPPQSFFAYRVDPGYRMQWCFRGLDAQQVEQKLTDCGLARDVVAGLLKGSSEVAGGIVLLPPDDVIIGLDIEPRTRLYAILALDPVNPAHMYPFSYRCNNLDEWLGGVEVADAVRKRLERLIYRRGPRLCLSDMHLVLPMIDYPLDAIRLQRTMRREEVITMQLAVAKDTDVQTLVPYWSGNRRRDQVEPILESFVGAGGGLLDITYLMPPFASSRLNRFPTLAPVDGVTRDCHWTSFNFMNDVPDDRFGASSSAVREMILQSHERVGLPSEFGDIVLLMHGDEGVVIHSCVYVAADIVFTKDGPSNGTAFALKRLSNVLEFYKAIAPVHIEYFRRRHEPSN